MLCACFRIACVSAPSVYQKLRELCREDSSVYIFEYDRRFAIYGDEFIFYDYNHPLELPERIAAHSFDLVVADPPYLSEECLRKTFLASQQVTSSCRKAQRRQNNRPIQVGRLHPRWSPSQWQNRSKPACSRLGEATTKYLGNLDSLS